MLSLILLAVLTDSPDDAPKPKLRPAAMILDLKGKVEIRPIEGKPRAAEIGDLLYPSEHLTVPAEGSATIAILGSGAREAIKVRHGSPGWIPGLHAARGRRVPQGAAAGRHRGDEGPPTGSR